MFFLLYAIETVAIAQSSTSDSLFSPVDNFFLSDKNISETVNDTIILVFPEEKVILKKSGDKQDERFFQNLENKAIKNKWIHELHNIIVIPPANPSKIDSITTESSVGKFVKYSGLIINEIKIVKLDVFGINIYDDSTFYKNNLITRTINSLHVKTQDRVLQRHLLFKPGDYLDPSVLSDNERIIRELPFIEDAKILIEPVPEFNDYVNIILVTKDVWSKAFFLEFKDINYLKLELFDKNILGTGMEIQNNLHWNPQKSDALGFESIYKNTNILGSFINSRLYYTNVFETESYGYKLERNFFTPNIKYAGGSAAYYLNTIRDVWSPDSEFVDTKIKLNYFDFWFGRSFKIKAGIPDKPVRQNLMISSGIFREYYTDRPEVTAESFYRYQNKTLWLNSIALSSQSFYKSNLIYNFGRTEDIPTGYLANLVFGPEFNEFKTRFYTSFTFSKGDYFDYLGYVNFKLALGGFHKKNGGIEQSLADVQLSWFTNLLILENYKFRFFSSINYLKGFDRFEDERIFINEPFGIRGINNKQIFGTQKLVLSFESLAFTPLNMLGFRFATSVFTDLAFIADENKSIFSDRFYSGIGLGIRFKNERLVFPAFQLRIVYYPRFPDLKPADMIKFLGEPRLYHEKYYPGAPAVLNY